MRIMIADRSAVVRSIIQQNLQRNKENKIIASVSTCEKILDCVKNLTPDLIICGNETGESPEKECLMKLCIEQKFPVLILSVTSEADSLPVPAKYIEVINKPNIKGYTEGYFDLMREKIKILISRNSVAKTDKDSKKEKFKILCLGASTGGPTAVSEVLGGLGSNFPLPVLYTQHIEIGKDEALVKWLNEVCSNITVKLAEDGEVAKPGVVYMAPADRHLKIGSELNDKNVIIKITDEAPERYLRPAVNKLFMSAAANYKSHTLAVLLTGMGADGANGCKEICNNGGWTIVEDKSTCVVFGMPAAAIEAGGAKEILPRNEIAKRILELTRK